MPTEDGLMHERVRNGFWAILLMVLAVLAWPACGAEAEEGAVWVDQGAEGQARVHLYLFWSTHCPHCLEALPFVQGLRDEHPWLVVHAHGLSGNPENNALYERMARSVGREARSVPAFLFCERMETGFDSPEITGALLVEALQACRQRAEAGLPLADGPSDFALAGLGIDPRTMPLPVLTVVLALLDSFNPCAFFVLFFLLSLLARAGGRQRMLLVGGLFVTISGVIYFLFMSAWLNLFLVIGHLRWITLAAGLVALTIALLDIKDFFFLGRGPSASIPAGARPGLFRRMRDLVGAERLSTVLLATLVLAVSANTYELLCTAGFPMVFTRLLTLEGEGTASHSLYLVLYNLVYVLPLFAIVAAFAFTVGARKLTEEEGRGLKLLSGLMLLELGLVLLLAPRLLSSLWVATGLVVSALLAGLLLYRWRLRQGGRA
ncbi:MAG: hypothetical protein ACOZAI_08590 [Pseudomonadota bacterium]